jgi:hypothetical protein
MAWQNARPSALILIAQVLMTLVETTMHGGTNSTNGGFSMMDK